MKYDGDFHFSPINGINIKDPEFADILYSCQSNF